jgi:hypothetical protein
VYKHLEANPDVEFEFFLADRLGMMVATLRDVMSADEFLGWSMFHARRAQRRQLSELQARHG